MCSGVVKDFPIFQSGPHKIKISLTIDETFGEEGAKREIG